MTQLKEDIDRITRHDLKSPLHGSIGVPDYLMETLPLKPEDGSLLQGVKDAGVKMLWKWALISFFRKPWT